MSTKLNVRTALALALLAAGTALAFTLAANPTQAGDTNAKASCCPDGACCPGGPCCTAEQSSASEPSCCPGGACCPEGACCSRLSRTTAPASCCPDGGCCPDAGCCGTAAARSLK